MGGHWDGTRPTCVGLSQYFNYTTDRPPTVLFRHINGQIAQSNDGQLVVTPGNIIIDFQSYQTGGLEASSDPLKSLWRPP